ncbi:DEAD/DEAH box helicase [Carnobacterium maltaromaticum]|uniref:DEAD/DEAH box helicase n=1 Tax=Carnobacterium maltaromaticum TaxID=2751 RepID=UPI001071BFFA|nr:DEAD/DEAH box helicase [Carnobacterium maltaromaticum]TFJ71832.1 RNA helicase [Carnobacterium maltaromaticum]TFJ76745.1 RNA helicase [Carnobacterium maltaromaticum]
MKLEAKELQAYWEKLGYQEPSVIQEKAYEPMKEGADVVGISPTGTGKTVAYTLPILAKTVVKGGLQTVIITPSQELAVQVAAVVKEWAKEVGITVQPLIGGASIKRQLEKLKQKPEIVVGTAGRILEISEMKKLKLHQVATVILDEADQLLQQDQLATVRKVVAKIPNKPQLAFFSATSNELMQDLPKWFNVEPLWLDVTAEDTSAGKVLHAYIETPNRKRTEMLKRLTQISDFRALVFINNVANLVTVAEKLSFEGVSVAVLHGEKYKTERQHALQQFRNGKVKLLLTTDVASRGLDIQGLPYVIQYDLPVAKESYVHRSGRTARMGQAGTVLTLVNERDLRDFKKVIAPLELELTRLYLFGGELMNERPETITDEVTTKTTEKSKAKAKEKNTEQLKSSTKPDAVVKKKHKKKDQKNKGARKKKIDK